MKYKEEFLEYVKHNLVKGIPAHIEGMPYYQYILPPLKLAELFVFFLDYEVDEIKLRRICGDFENNFQVLDAFDVKNNIDNIAKSIESAGAVLESILRKVAYLNPPNKIYWDDSVDADIEGISVTMLADLIDGKILKKKGISGNKFIPIPLIRKDANTNDILLFIRQELRNAVHSATERKDRAELQRYTNMVLGTYLLVIETNYLLIEKLSQYDFTPYLQTKLTEFQKNLLSDYTDLNAKETDLYDENLTPMAKEYYEADFDDDYDEDDDEEEDFDEEDFELVEETVRITKPTKVNEIREQVPQMLIRGDAGMGKTTTLEHLFLADLQNALQNPAIIPFFFELKDYNGNDLFKQIAKQNKVDETTLRKAIESGKVCLFLDGFDEILNADKRNNLEIIIKDQILTTTSQVLISSRVREYEHDIFKMRVFDLQALSNEQIREYASKNISEDKKAIFLQALFEKENSILLSICRNIFILKVYKNEIIEAKNGEISSKNIGKLLQNLVNRRVDRQIRENKPNANLIKKDLGKYKKMINFLAYTLIDKELSFEYDTTIELLKNEVGDLRLADECLNFYKSIGLIKGETDILKFTHKLYWEYFAAESIWSKIQVKYDDIQNYIAIPKWKKVLNLVRGLAGEQSTKIVETVAVADALTMAESISSSIEQKPEEVLFVIEEAEKQARNFENAEVSAQGFLALMELSETDKVLNILNNIVVTSIHKNVIEHLINQIDTNKALDIIEILMLLPNKQNQLKIWALESFDKEINNESTKQRLCYLIEKSIINLGGQFLYVSGILITEYNLEHKFPIESIVEKLIKSDKIQLLLLAEKLIEKYSLQNIFLISCAIEKLIQKGDVKILHLAEFWIAKYQIQDKFPPSILIEKLIQKGELKSLKSAEIWINKYQIQDKFPPSILIEKLIHNREQKSLKFAETLINKYQIQDKFFIINLIEKFVQNGGQKSLKFAEAWIDKYQLKDIFPIKPLVEKLIQNGRRKLLRFAELWIAKYHIKDVIIIENLIKKSIYNEELKSLHLAANWINKYKIKNKSIIILLIEKLITTEFVDFLQLAENLIAEYQLQDKFSIENLIDKLIVTENVQFLQLAGNLIAKYQLQDKFSIETIIQKLIFVESVQSLQLAGELITKHQLQDKFSIEDLIQKLIQIEKVQFLQLAEELITKYQLQDKFSIEGLVDKLIKTENIQFIQLAGRLIVKYQLQDKFSIESLIDKLIENGNVDSLQLAENLIENYSLQEKFSIESLIEKLIQNRAAEFLVLAKTLVEKHQLQDTFPIKKLIEKLTQNQDEKSLRIAKKWRKKYNSKNKETTKKLSKNSITESHITKIISSRVFVQIQNENRVASIYIGDLTDVRLDNIHDFEYNGEKLHIGQKLVAKVIDIDEQDRINLSLKGIKKD